MGLRGRLGTAVVLAVLVAFADVRGLGFVNMDDDVYVTDNPAVLAGLTLDGVRWAFTEAHGALWLPLAWLSHMADVELYGLDPAGHHVGNLLLHAANTLLLFLGLTRLTGRLVPSAVAAAAFALHPLRVESVAWVTERKDLLAACFALLTIGAWVRWTAAPSRARYACVLLVFACALLSKPMVVTLPVALLLLDLWPLRRVELGAVRLLREKAPIAFLGGAVAALTLATAHDAGALPSLSLDGRLRTVVVGYGWYVGRTLWPVGLGAYHPLPAAWPAWRVAAGATTVTALVAVAAVSVRRRPWLTVGLAWFVVTLLPVSGLFQAGQQAYADRFSYLPGLGLVVALVWAGTEAMARLRIHRRAVGVVVLVLLTALGVLTRRQVAHWRTSRTLFEHTLRVTRDNWFAHGQMGDALLRTGDRVAALVHYEAAVALEPRFAPSRLGRAVALDAVGRHPEALAEYREAIRLDPKHHRAWSNLGAALLRADDAPGAIDAFVQAVRLRPGWAVGRANLVAALERHGVSPDAAARYARDVGRLGTRPTAARGSYEGMLRSAALGSRGAALGACLHARPGEPPLPFDVRLVVDAGGHVVGAIAEPATPVGDCFRAALAGERVPPPPHAPYEARIPIRFAG